MMKIMILQSRHALVYGGRQGKGRDATHMLLKNHRPRKYTKTLAVELSVRCLIGKGMEHEEAHIF